MAICNNGDDDVNNKGHVRGDQPALGNVDIQAIQVT